MSDLPKQKNGRRNIGRRASIIRSPAEIELNERIRRRLIRLVKSRDAPSRAIQDICEGRGAPVGMIGRRVLELMDADYPTGEIKALVLGETDRWIDDLAARRRLDPAA